MYKYVNKNPYGLYENDCTVRAICTAEGTTWDYTYDKLSNLAQANRTMMDDREFIQRYLDAYYPTVPYLPKLVGEVAAAYPDNVLLITMNGHITCSRYGIVIDSFDCRDRVAEEAWVVV